MTHFFGIPMDEKKVLWKALAEIPGVGKKTAFNACNKAGLLPVEFWGNLHPKDQKWLHKWLEENIVKDHPIGTEYWRARRQEYRALVALGSYRGIRRRQGFPARGQKTHSNAQTAKKFKF